MQHLGEYLVLVLRVWGIRQAHERSEVALVLVGGRATEGDGADALVRPQIRIRIGGNPSCSCEVNALKNGRLGTEGVCVEESAFEKVRI